MLSATLSPVIEMAILGLLKERPMHGYDLRKRLRSDLGLLSSLSFGSLYPALGRLKAQGLVRELPAEHEIAHLATRLPASGSLTGERAAFRARLAVRAGNAAREARTGGRAKRVYELTSAGAEHFERLLSDLAPAREDDRAFSLRWAFARHLAPEARLMLLERRRRHLEGRLDGATRTVTNPPRPLDRFEGSLAEHSRDVLRADIDWIDHLIETERADLGAPRPSEVS